MKKRRLLSIGLIAVMVATLSVGCGSGEEEKTDNNAKVVSQSEDGELVIGMNSDIIACDPAFAYDNNTNAVVCQITEGLLAFDQDNKLVPKLAESLGAKR